MSPCLLYPLCWPLALAPPHSCHLRHLLFAVCIWWRDSMPLHCFVFRRKSQTKKAGRRAQRPETSWLRYHMCLDVQKALFGLSFNTPWLWLISGLQPNPGEVRSAVLWIGAICRHGSGQLTAVTSRWTEDSRNMLGNSKCAMRMAGMQCVICPNIKDQYLCECRGRQPASNTGRQSQGIWTWLWDS